MTEGRSFFWDSDPAAHSYQARLLGDELPPRLYPVPYLLGLPLQRLKAGKHLSVSGQGRVVSVRRTSSKTFHQAIPFPAHP
jgi:hypothetical protein